MNTREGLMVFDIVRETYPGAILCGSLSLILLRKMQERDMHDIDYIVKEDEVDEVYLKENGVYPVIEHSNYKCYAIPFMGIVTSCFVVSKDYELETIEYMGITHQHPEITIKRKMELNREKDKKDQESFL